MSCLGLWFTAYHDLSKSMEDLQSTPTPHRSFQSMCGSARGNRGE
jgi:hypothetical protein